VWDCSLPTSIISHCSVHNSNQRCYVMHGTHNMSLTENVAWRATGHCFMLEDGTEHANTYLRNVGILTVPPVVCVSWSSPPQASHPSSIRNTLKGTYFPTRIFAREYMVFFCGTSHSTIISSLSFTSPYLFHYCPCPPPPTPSLSQRRGTAEIGSDMH
jgi:hypothetical protein